MNLGRPAYVPSTKETGSPGSPKPCCKVVKHTTCAHKTPNCIDDAYRYILHRATVGLNVATMVMILDPSAPPVYHAFLSLPNIALENSMACRVFRAIHLGTIRFPSSTSRSLSTSGSLAVRVPSGMIRYEDRFPHPIRPQMYNDLHSTPLDITVTTEYSSLEDTSKKHTYTIDQGANDAV